MRSTNEFLNAKFRTYYKSDDLENMDSKKLRNNFHVKGINTFEEFSIRTIVT